MYESSELGLDIFKDLTFNSILILCVMTQYQFDIDPVCFSINSTMCLDDRITQKIH